MTDPDGWAQDDARSDDGIRGPVGESFGAALHAAGAARDFGVGYPKTFGHWVDQPWRGRHLTIRWSPYGAQGRTTGYRWITIRMSTTTLGLWADPPTHDADKIMGVGLPVTPDPPSERGTWADEPQLSADIWAFAMRMAPHGHPSEQPRFTVLQARNDGVVWHLRASRLDPDRLIEAIDVLERVALYAERNDAALVARLGRAKGVREHRRFEAGFAVFVIGTILAIIAAMFVFAYAF